MERSGDFFPACEFADREPCGTASAKPRTEKRTPGHFRDRVLQCAFCCCRDRSKPVATSCRAAACIPQESHLAVAAYSSPHVQSKRFTGSPPLLGGSRTNASAPRFCQAVAL